MKQEPNNPKNGIAGRLNMAGWRKHYVAAITADEDAWPQREPGSNLGRVFIILLLLHVFLIGAVVLYNVISPKAPPALTSASSEPARPSATHSGAAPLAVPKAVAISVAANTNAGPTTSSAAIHSSLKPIDTAIYDVRSGDNVPGIAAALGVSAEDLIKLNNLDNTELYPGRKLTYPKKTVAPTLKALAVPSLAAGTPIPVPAAFSVVTPARESAPPATLKDRTAVTLADQPPAAKPRNLEPSGGTKPKKPTSSESPKPVKTASKSEKSSKADSPAKTVAKTGTSSKAAASRRSHSVGPKETLYSIARKYGVKTETLQKANGIKDPTTLREGMKLVIPAKS